MVYINIDSKDRTNGDEFDFDINNQPIQNKKYINIKSIEMPIGWYNIRNFNNILKFKIYDSVDMLVNSYSITLENGNYTGANIIAILQSLMNAVISGTTTTITYSTITNKITISLTNSFYIEIIETELSKILGFSNLQKGQSNINSVNCCNLNFDNYIILNIKGAQSQYNNNISIKLPVNVNQGQVLNLIGNNDLFNQKLEILDNVLYNLHIKITDKYGQSLSNNGIDWSMTIELN